MGATYKGKDFKFKRKVRPRYNKLLIPALIISFIIAVILILILRKYLLKPLLEEEGLFDRTKSALVVKAADPHGGERLFIFSM